MKIAIVTGASSGLGIEYIKSIVRDRTEIEKIWIIARRENVLNGLAAEYGENKIVPFPLDLTDGSCFEKISEKLKCEKPEVSLLVNNAGVGTLGDFDKEDLASQTRMDDLNVRALTAVTLLTLPYMKKGGSIINVCSIAAFCPNARMTVYSSTKAYVMSFSRGLRFELKDCGINVLAVCPGPMDTEFLPVAGITKGASHTFDTLPRCKPESVAEISLKKAAKGRAVYTPTVFYKFYRFVAKVLPHGIVLYMSKA